MVKGVVLCAGEGTRLRPLTNDRPKVMVEIGGRPLLEQHVRMLKHFGITEIAFNIFHKKDVIKSHFGDGSRFGVRIHYLEEEQLSGTAGAIKQLEGFLDQTFVVQYGDVAAAYDVKRFIAHHKKHGGIATLFVHPSGHPYDSDIVEMDKDLRVRRFKRVKQGEDFVNLTNAGAYVMEPAICRHIPSRQNLDFGRDVFVKILPDSKVRIYGYPCDEYTKDMGTMDRLKQVEADLAAGKFRFYG